MLRSLLLCAAIAFVGCAKDHPPMTAYCDDTGCFACSDVTHTKCWPLPHDGCSTQSDCQAGDTCTNIGCCHGCHSDGDCRSGEFCSTQGYCVPIDTNPVPVGSTGTTTMTKCATDADCTGGYCNAGLCYATCTADSQCPSGNVCDGGKCRLPGAVACGLTATFCGSDAQCGTGRVCLGGACHQSCASSGSCPLGQACASSVCVDAAPASSQCVWDRDCGPASRCINAWCHPLCAVSSQCAAGEFCDSGVCRADYRPAS